MKINGIVIGAAALFLTACEQPEPILEGERIDLRAPAQTSAAPASAVRLPAPRSVASWGHRNANPEHLAPHAAIPAQLRPAWSVSIGEGETRRARITADPVSDGARIYAMDATATLTAVTTAGQVVWTRDLTPAGEKPGLASGGGLAVAGGVVYATTTYGTLTAFDAATGQMRWVQRLQAVPSGPPTVRGDVVYFVTRDNRAWALETSTGRIRWQLPGLPTTTAFSGGAGPAVTDKIAVFPFSSGELIAVLRQGGVRLWSSSISGRRIGRVYAAIGDYAADPLIMGGNVYAATQSGRLVGIDLDSGDRLWTAQFGALGPILGASNTLWVVTDDGDLARISATNGQKIWTQPLPYFTEEKIKRRAEIYAHFGPILAGGRLIVASSDNRLRTFDPSSGAPLGDIALASGAAAAPMVVGNTLYILTTDGHLRAFR